jgi:hypothetical protein
MSPKSVVRKMTAAGEAMEGTGLVATITGAETTMTGSHGGAAMTLM